MLQFYVKTLVFNDNYIYDKNYRLYVISVTYIVIFSVVASFLCNDYYWCYFKAHQNVYAHLVIFV